MGFKYLESLMESINPFLFWIVFGLTALCAIATVVTHNIVRAATWLLFTLAGTSAIFFLLGADIVGAVQLLVYVGGTLILVIFGVMLTAQGPFISMKTSGAEWAISVFAGLALLGVLGFGVFKLRDHPLGVPADLAATEPQSKNAPTLKQVQNQKGRTSQQSTTLGQAFLGVGLGPAHRGEAGATVRTNYLLPFELVSIHLLVVLIGAAYLARSKRRQGATL
jgi:NADH-quinone oxidoreductase subunit J